jgi:hypothetical protein
MKLSTKLLPKTSVNQQLLESVEIHSMEPTLSMSLNVSSLIQKPKVSFSLEKLVEKLKNKLQSGFQLTTQETSQLSVSLPDKPHHQEEEWVMLEPLSPVEKEMPNLRLLA